MSSEQSTRCSVSFIPANKTLVQCEFRIG